MKQMVLCTVKAPDEMYYHWHGDELMAQDCITVPFPLLNKPIDYSVPMYKDSDVYNELKGRGIILEEQDITLDEYTEMHQRNMDMLKALSTEPS